ncbi:hypothetical protein J2S13_000097 [Oikeobacillus pervagus]|uniref:ABC transporter periplasmic binding protein yphF n=2 Tax=Oikeobacillus pervagus TaxID=1325931 RepID=A0AAJ1WHV3_9BACI|nr:hypothetical protein [Oikeobacillus pervagus]
MRKRFFALFISVFTITILSGCMFPEEKKSQNQVPYENQIQSVQSAVEQFREKNDGILPIKTKEQDTPIYLKYPIDFKKLAPEFMAEPPGNAYESGGVFQYVLIDVEDQPTVKIFDLRIAEQIRELNIRLQAHQYPPFKEEIVNNVYTLDYSKLGYKEEPHAVSPYSNKNLPFVMTGDGKIYVDYRMDLYELLKKEKHSYKTGEDIRPLLTKDSVFVPAYSLPYTVDDKKEPIFLQK